MESLPARVHPPSITTDNVALMQRRPRGATEELPWDDVRLFLALCRARHLGGAAEALGVDASTVSRRLAAMEEVLSVTLFERGRDGIAPTEAAEELMPVRWRARRGCCAR